MIGGAECKGTDQSRAVIARKVFVANLNEAIKGVFDGHMHEQDGGDGRLTLAIAFFRVQHGVRL